MNALKETGGAAFPQDHIDSYGIRTSEGGMTLRDYFAAKALAGMLADLPKTMYGLEWQRNVAEAAYQVADAMLASRGAA